MTCDEAKTVLHALIDGELDVGQARKVGAHVAGCQRCEVELRQFREMRQAMSSVNLSLRCAEGATPAHRGYGSHPVRSHNCAVASFVAAGFCAWHGLVGDCRHRRRVHGGAIGPGSAILGDVVSAHLRSLQAGHLTDVPSGDQNTVKPWFSGKLAVAPPVIDLTAQGFILLGGRLDTIDGKPAAVIVYRRGIHVINLFVAAAASAGHSAARGAAVQGFSTQRWSDQGLSFIAISDLSADELRDFHVKFETGLRAGA